MPFIVWLRHRMVRKSNVVNTKALPDQAMAVMERMRAVSVSPTIVG